jgi:hypothetical protein
MAQFEISLTRDYVPSWSTWEGIRELLQNAQDEAEANPEHAMHIDYSVRTTKLVITSEGVTLDRSVLLLGASGKRGTRARGIHGEGLDLALLVLTRIGAKIRIENGAESWIPDLRFSEKWGQDILVIETNKFQKPRAHFRVEIEGITPEGWELVRKRCLFLPGSIDPKEHVLKVGDDRVLLDRPGEVYVRGLWVAHLAEMTHGYDLAHADLDRDRRLIEEWKLRGKLADIWLRTLGDEMLKVEARQRVKALLDKGARDVEGLDTGILYGTAGAATQAAKAALVETFQQEYGQAAVPVSSTSEAEEAKAAGLVPVPVNSVWKKTLEASTGKPFTERIQDAQKDISKVLTPDDLATRGLLTRWTTVRNLLKLLTGALEVRLSIVEFRGADTLGQKEGIDLRLSVKLLEKDQPGEAIAALIHEAAHLVAHDHNHRHELAGLALMAKLTNAWYLQVLGDGWDRSISSPKEPS